MHRNKVHTKENMHENKKRKGFTKEEKGGKSIRGGVPTCANRSQVFECVGSNLSLAAPVSTLSLFSVSTAGGLD